MIMTILTTILKVLLYGYGGYCMGRHTSHLIDRLIKKKKLSTPANRELKARYFEKCQDLVARIGTKEWDDSDRDIFFDDLQNITNEMCEAGMGRIAKQEYDNIKKLCNDLGYIQSDKDL